MKKTALLFTVLFLTSNVFAGLFEKGIKAGINLDNFDEAKSSYEGETNQLNISVGFFARINLPFLLIQPEVYFSQKKPTLDSLSIDLSSINVPLLVGYRLLNAKIFQLRLMAGPVFSYNLNTNYQINKTTQEDIKKSLNSSGIGGQVGIGVDVSKLIFDARYGFNGGDVKEFTKGYFHLALGYKF